MESGKAWEALLPPLVPFLLFRLNNLFRIFVMKNASTVAPCYTAFLLHGWSVREALFRPQSCFYLVIVYNGHLLFIKPHNPHNAKQKSFIHLQCRFCGFGDSGSTAEMPCYSAL